MNGVNDQIGGCDVTELVPVEVLPASNPDGERWAAGIELVREWLNEVKDNTRATYADAIGFPFHPVTDEYRDFRTLRNGVTWLAWCARNGVQLLDVTRRDVVEWTEALRTARSPKPPHDLLSASTRAHTFTAASSFYTWAMENGHIEVSPIKMVSRKKLGVKLQKRPSPTRSLSEDEVGSLQAAADGDPVELVRLRSSALIAFLTCTGVRIEEALRLRMSDIEHTGGVRMVWVTLKGDESHPVAIPPEVGERLDRYHESRGIGKDIALPGQEGGSDSPFLFATGSGKRMGQKEARELLVRLAERAGLTAPETVTPHVMRHTHITELQKLGLADTTIQKHIGHRQVETTQRYGHHVRALEDSPAFLAARAFEQATQRQKHKGDN